MQGAEPRRRPTATRMLSLSIRRPRADKGGAVSQAPASFCWEASRRALAIGDASNMRLEVEATATGLSHASWVPVAFPVGGSTEPEQEFQSLSASSS